MLQRVKSLFSTSLYQIPNSLRTCFDKKNLWSIIMNIYVGNLSFSTNEDEISALFAKTGDVDSVRIITDRDTGRSKGFGFVEMANSEQAKSAIDKLNGTELDGRSLTVNEAKPKTNDHGNSRRY